MINIKKFLFEHADEKYADFNKKFIKSAYQIVGVRIPILRKFAKEIEPEYIDLEDKSLTHEEILLYVYSAAENYKTEDEQLEYLQNILPYIDNWCTSDCIDTALKSLTGEKSYQFFTNLLFDEREFYIRVGIVGLMFFFLKTDKLDEILKNLKKIKSQTYYVKMATAWFFAELSTFNFSLAKEEISKIQDKFIRNKSISKACESLRLNKEEKTELMNLKK